MIRVAGSLIAALLLGACGSARSDSSLTAALERAEREAGARGGALYASVRRLEDGAILVDRRSDLLVRPGSILKLLTVAAALTRDLPPFVTELWEAPNGTLTLVGGGDPLLSSSDLERLAAARRVGPCPAIEVDDRRFAPPVLGRGWMWDDEPASFLPLVSALSVDRGCVLVEVTGRGDAPPQVVVTPEGTGVPIDRRWTTGSTESASVTRDPRDPSGALVVRGSPPEGHSTRSLLSVSDPSLAAGSLLARGLLDRDGRAPPVARGIASADSILISSMARPVADILSAVLAESDNLAAECLLRHAAGESSAERGLTAEQGLARVESYVDRVTNLQPRRRRIVDGSGVSHYDLIDLNCVVAALAETVADPMRGSRLLVHLASPGSGTLAGRLAELPARVTVRAKTGTISGVSSLAGVLVLDGRPHLVFGFTIQDTVGPPREVRSILDGLVVELARQAVEPF